MLFTKNQKTYFRSVWLKVSLFCAEEDWGRGWERKRWEQVRFWVCATTRGAYTDPLIGAHSMCEVYSVGLCKPLSLLAGSYNTYYNIIMGYFSIISGLSLSPGYCYSFRSRLWLELLCSQANNSASPSNAKELIRCVPPSSCTLRILLLRFGQDHSRRCTHDAEAVTCANSFSKLRGVHENAVTICSFIRCQCLPYHDSL